MSHIVTIRTEVRDPAAVAAACRRLGLPEPVHGTAINRRPKRKPSVSRWKPRPQAEGRTMTPTDFAQFLMGIPWFGWVAIVAILCGSVNRLVAQCQRHFERMAMIRQGMHPDGGRVAKPEKWDAAEV